MLAKFRSLTLLGLEGEVVDIETDIHRGMPKFVVVGLPDTAIQESRERVRSAIKNSGFVFPGAGNILAVNLAPADTKKQGPRFDLPIALSMLSSSGQLRLPSDLEKMIFIGELDFEGNVRPVSGVLPSVCTARDRGFEKIFVPLGNAEEASFIPGITVFGVRTLAEIVDHLGGTQEIHPVPPRNFESFLAEIASDFDMEHVRGQEQAKRALEVAAAGSHNILMVGPPGSGKTMLARALSTILPKLTVEEALEITKIHSIAGLTNEKNPIARIRPFRSVHHTASSIAIVGGGNPPKPGEISLAHRGVLFLDEFAEFPQKALEVMRQPIEDGVITVSRASGSYTFPSRMMLVAAMNPTPDGYFPEDERCTSTPAQIQKYQSKISGPILDRIDLHIEVPQISFEKISNLSPGDSSKTIRERVQNAREIQYQRFQEHGIQSNSEMTSSMVKKFCELDEQGKMILRAAVDQMNLSGRAFYRILKLSRTIADLEKSEKIEVPHLAEAISYREKRM